MYKTLRLRPLLQRTCRRARSSNTRSSTTTTATTATAASRTTAATPSESVSPLRRAIAGYEAMLETSPILTKSATGGVLYGIGDSIAQTITRRQAVANGGEDGGFDTARWLRAVAFGGIFYPLPAHIHYNFLERFVVVRMATPASRVPFVKMFIEQFVYWSYFSNAYVCVCVDMCVGVCV